MCICVTLNCSLQEKATKWHENGQIDGVTTNGVLIMHPRGSFCGGEAKCGLWREVSVGGSVFCVRGPRSAQRKEVSVSYDTVCLETRASVFLKTYSVAFFQLTPKPIKWSPPFRFSNWNFLLIYYLHPHAVCHCQVVLQWACYCLLRPSITPLVPLMRH